MDILFHLRKNICLNRICVIFEYFLIINMDREVPEKAPEDHHHLAMAISNPAPDIFSLALASSSLSVTIINLIFWSKSVATPRLGLSLLKWKEVTGGRNLTRWTMTLTLSGSDEVETNWEWSISLDWLGWLLWMAIMFFKFEVFSEICFIQVALSTSSNSEALGTTLRLITLLETDLMTVLMRNKMVWRSNR